jgi:hypothetical protein
MIIIRKTDDLAEAESLWRALSPGQTIFDEWDFRYCFYKYNPYPLNFLVAYEVGAGREVPVGLLPLQLHPEYGYEFLAEDPCEENRLFIKSGYEKIIPDLYGAVNGPAKCYDISGEDEFTRNLPLEDYKYILPLTGLHNFADFLNSRLAAKRRRSLTKELEVIAASSPEIIVSQPEDNLANLEKLFIFNNLNFVGESYLKTEEQDAWRDLLKLPFAWRLMIVNIQGQTQAVSLSVLHNNEWHYMVTGVNFKDFPGLGKYLVKANIEQAILADAAIFDAGLGDCGWKNLWHFDRLPQYEFKHLVD